MVVLDLDETLVHTCKMQDKPDIVLDARDQLTPGTVVPMKVRPHVCEFLKKVSREYEIVVFTASGASYANAIVDYLDPSRKYIVKVLSRFHCLETKNGFVVKDLRVFSNRNMKDIIIVDNLVHSFGFQLENGFPILEFTDDDKDEELLHLADFLLEIAPEDDLRVALQNKLRLRELASFEEKNLFSPTTMPFDRV